MCSRVYGEQTIGNVPTETSDTVRVPRGRARALNVLELEQSEKRQLLTTWGMSLNCLNVFPLAIGHRLSRMAVKGFIKDCNKSRCEQHPV